MKELFQKENILNLRINSVREMGFTLIELMITLVIAAIILSMAAPSFVRAIDNNRVTTAVNDFSASLALAKIEAVKRNRNVKLVANSSDWALGYEILGDLNNDGDYDDANEKLKVADAVDGAVKVAPVGPDWDDPKVAAPVVIEFNSLGGLVSTGHIAFDSYRASETVEELEEYACRRVFTLIASGVFTMRKEALPCDLPELY